MALDRGKLLARFLQEAREHCAAINGGLLSLEKNPDDRETMNEICRSAHTIKGSSRMMKIGPVAAIAHGMEDVLDALKNAKIAFSAEIYTLLFRGVDVMHGMLDGMVEGGVLPAPDDNLCVLLQRVAGGDSLVDTPAAPPVCESTFPPYLDATFTADLTPGAGNTAGSLEVVASGGNESVPSREGTAAEGALQTSKTLSGDTIRIAAEKLDGLIKLMGEISSGRARFQGTLPLLREALRLSGVLEDLHSATEVPESAELPHRDASLQVVKKLQALLEESYCSLKDEILSQEATTWELLQVTLEMRTLPLSTIFDTFPRAVRDLSRTLGKEIEFTLVGGETELDKMIIEKIGDPLMHMIRNAIDHGIESKEERCRAGKGEKGTISLSAWCEGSSVTILVRDDGRGICLEKLRARALQKSIVDRDTLDAMSEAELTDLIFLPGFSTSEIVTDLSGRGVGLDVVRKNIREDLKGSIRIDSTEGVGTAISLKVPLNLALFSLLFVSASNRVFALLDDAVEEVVAVTCDQLITVVNKRAIRLRNEVIPVENLAVLLNLPDCRGKGSEQLLIAIVTSGNEKLGLVIDAVLDEDTVIVKPLPSPLKNVRIVSGVTIRGKNQIVPLLAVSALCSAAREKKGVRPAVPATEVRKERTVLVVDDSISTREIEKSIIEAHGYQVVVAGDGIEALEKAREKIFDVIVTDIEMPRLDGFSLTEKLRMDERYRHTPIIIVTSRERDEDKRRGILVGANAYIVKGSFDQTSLIETLESLVA
jgi:chemotaxis protein histidine kinase CheA